METKLLEYTSNNTNLIQAINDFYNRDISAMKLGDIYMKNKLYSAASTYYSIEINSLLDDTNSNDIISYCFSQMAECYFLQQKDRNFSSWQLEMIYDLCKEAITYNNLNFKAYIILGGVYELQKKQKDAYFCYQYVINHLQDIKLNNKSEGISIYNMILHYFDICDYYFIIKYENVLTHINKFILTYKEYFTYDLIEKLYHRINQHKTIDPYELKIIEGLIY